MANPLQSSGEITLHQIRRYVGITGQMSLSGITNPYSANQIFNSQALLSAGIPTPPSNSLSLSNLYSKTFGCYSVFNRTLLHSNSYSDLFTGEFKAYLGFGTSSNGSSGTLYQINQGIPIFIQINTTNQFIWSSLVIRGRFQGVWQIIGPPLGYTGFSWFTDPTVEIEEMTIEMIDFGIQAVLDMIVSPSYGEIGTGGHVFDIIRLLREEPDPSSSSGFPPPK